MNQLWIVHAEQQRRLAAARRARNVDLLGSYLGPAGQPAQRAGEVLERNVTEL